MTEPIPNGDSINVKSLFVVGSVVVVIFVLLSQLWKGLLLCVCVCMYICGKGEQEGH